MPVVLPHHLLCYLYKHTSMFVKATTGLKQFWKHFHACTDPSLTWPREWNDSTVPMGLHGDDCRFTETGQKVICMSLNFLLDDSQQRYPLFAVRFETRLQLLS